MIGLQPLPASTASPPHRSHHACGRGIVLRTLASIASGSAAAEARRADRSRRRALHRHAAREPTARRRALVKQRATDPATCTLAPPLPDSSLVVGNVDGSARHGISGRIADASIYVKTQCLCQITLESQRQTNLSDHISEDRINQFKTSETVARHTVIRRIDEALYKG